MRRSAALALLLLTLACGRADHNRARGEAALRGQLASMRNAIAVYTKTHGHGPATLRDAIPSVPVDPLTHSATTWRLTTEENVRVDDFTTIPGPAARSAIIDVHSGAPGRDGRGRGYGEY
ncbi:MAG TPA: hypothetical protein VNN08_08400 [Thermoanaerobaculia bacterium]|nr:hypothetical protein [Thermoanaerobaculia bacterium]